MIHLVGFFLSLILFSTIQAENYSYFPKALEVIEEDVKQATTPIDRALSLIDLQSLLLTLLKSDMDSSSYYSLLKTAEWRIKAILAQSKELPEYNKKRHKCIKIPFTVAGSPTWLYENRHGYSQDRALTDQEKEAFFQIEFEAYQKSALNQPAVGLNSESIEQLIIGVPYNFVVKPNLEVCFGPNQEYNLHDPETNAKTLISPGHGILSKNEPVLAAGEFVFYRNNDKVLFLLSSASGHFRPDVECLVHLEDQLVQMGVPREAIFSSAVPLSNLARKTLEKIYKAITAE